MALSRYKRDMGLGKLKTLLILGGAFGGGLCTGQFARTQARFFAGERALKGNDGPKVEAHFANSLGGSEVPSATNSPPALVGKSEAEHFGGTELQKQAEVLKRLSLKEGKELRTSTLALLGEIIPQLSADEAANLLGELPGGRLEHDEIRRFLAERLAELDAPRALEMGKQLGDAKLLGTTLLVMGEKNVASALAVVKTLPLEQGKEVLSSFLQQATGSSMYGATADRAGWMPMKGTALEVAAVLKETPAMRELGINGVFGVTELLGGLMARSGERSPAAVLATVQSLATELSALKKDATEHTYDQNTLNHGMLQGFLKDLRASDPVAASAFFDAIPDSAKSQWMFAEEAHARFKSGGIDAAISLAERQVNEDFAKRAASGAWWGLAQQDRAGALTWVESLPPGTFRTGVLNAVMWDAWNQSMSWGSDTAAIEAGARLLSKQSQMDYFASLMSSRRFGGRGSAPSEMIAQLPISEAERNELYRRIAPVKAP